MTMDRQALAARADAWARTHQPDTGYTRAVFQKLAAADLPAGTNLLTEAAAQWTGQEEAEDHLEQTPEFRIPYSHTNRFCLDRQTDCSGFWYAMFQIFFGMNIGTWTEAIYSKQKRKRVSWNERRVGDLVLYNFKKGRRASHVACIVKHADWGGQGGLIGHTTSPKNPFRFESDKYQAGKRVGVYRVLSDEQYQSLFV